MPIEEISELEFTVDGIAATITASPGETYSYQNSRSRPSRIFVFEDETIPELIARRHSRPQAIWARFVRAGLRAALPDMFDDQIKVVFDQRAGCPCPCSPGFFVVRNGHRQAITDDGPRSIRHVGLSTPRFDFFIQTAATLTLDDARSEARRAQLIGV